MYKYDFRVNLSYSLNPATPITHRILKSYLPLSPRLHIESQKALVLPFPEVREASTGLKPGDKKTNCKVFPGFMGIGVQALGHLRGCTGITRG